MSKKTLDNIFIYRMTHIENIPHILQYGITHKSSNSANDNYRAIGDVSVISNRETLQRQTINGDTIVLGNFIPFYFGVRMPMLYVIQTGGNQVSQVTKPDDIVYVACGVNRVASSQDECYFTDGHAIDAITKFYDKTQLFKLPDVIDWTAIEAKYWGGNENLILKCRKQAEFLAKSDIPIDYIHGYACYSDAAKAKLISFGINEGMIIVRPNIYY